MEHSQKQLSSMVVLELLLRSQFENCSFFFAHISINKTILQESEEWKTVRILNRKGLEL